MGETTTLDPAHQALRDRGRRTVFGYLGPYLLHETNNVLTVMSGIRQLMRMNRELPEKVGPMIDGQLEKVERLMDWIRSLNPDSRACSHDMLLESMASLVRLAGKGRRIEVECSPAPGELLGTQVEPLAIGVLCGLLALLPRGIGERATLGLQIADATQFSAWIQPAGSDPLEEPDVLLGREILEGAGLAPRFSGGRGQEFRIDLCLPA